MLSTAGRSTHLLKADTQRWYEVRCPSAAMSLALPRDEAVMHLQTRKRELLTMVSEERREGSAFAMDRMNGSRCIVYRRKECRLEKTISKKRTFASAWTKSCRAYEQTIGNVGKE